VASDGLTSHSRRIVIHLVASSLVEILYRNLQDFLGSCKFTQDPTQDPKMAIVILTMLYRILLRIP